MSTEPAPDRRQRAAGRAGERARGADAIHEADLIARLAAGERDEPLTALHRSYGPCLYGLGMRLLGDAGMAEELVQDTFVRLWRSSARFDPELASLRTYIFTIARRAAVDLHRRAASRPLPTGRDDGLVELEESTVSDDEFDQVVLSLGMREALDALSHKHCEVLELHYEHDLTQSQIAERLELPLGTVKTRTYHALRALRSEVEDRDLGG